MRAVWLLVLLAVVGTQAIVFDASIDHKNTQYKYLGKFAFDQDGGELTVQLELPVNQKPGESFIAFYYDMDEYTWDNLYTHEYSCGYKLSKAYRKDDVTDPEFAKSPGKLYTIDGSRPRWWHVMLFNCVDPIEHLRMPNYYIHMYNQGGKYTREISYDQQGIFEGLIVFLLILIVLMFLIVRAYRRAAKKTDENRVDQMMLCLMVLVGLEIFVYLLKIIHFDSLSSDGQGVVELMQFATVVHVIPHALLVALFIFLARGWQIQYSEFPVARIVWEVVVLYLICNVIALWWVFRSIDHATQDWIYQSAGGTVLVLLRVAVLLFFLKNVVKHRRQVTDSAKRRLYTLVAAIGVVWFLELPILVLIAAAQEDWNRAKTVDIFEMLINTAVYVSFYFVFWHNQRYLAEPGTAKRRKHEPLQRGSEMFEADGLALGKAPQGAEADATLAGGDGDEEGEI